MMYAHWYSDGMGHDEVGDFPLVQIDDGSWFGDWVPDVIHAQQHPTARKARELFPDVPLVYVCHSHHWRYRHRA
jgi:hypothetical protein